MALPDIAELRDTATRTATTTDRENVWAAADRLEAMQAMAREMVMSVPGGQFCDPQEVADTLREIAKRHGVTVE